MRMGFAMRQQSIAAVFAKALRLNSSSIADISEGKVCQCHPVGASIEGYMPAFRPALGPAANQAFVSHVRCSLHSSCT